MKWSHDDGMEEITEVCESGKGWHAEDKFCTIIDTL